MPPYCLLLLIVKIASVLVQRPDQGLNTLAFEHRRERRIDQAQAAFRQQSKQLPAVEKVAANIAISNGPPTKPVQRVDPDKNVYSPIFMVIEAMRVAPQFVEKSGLPAS